MNKNKLVKEGKKYGVIHESDICDTPEEVAKIFERKGTNLKYRIFELGDEYEAEVSTVIRHISKK